MAAEEVLLLLSLFESNWFGHNNKANPCEPHQEKTTEDSFSVVPNLKVRSFSEQLLDPKLLGSSSFSSDNCLSPNSVLTTQKLQTIFSGKEVKDDRAHDDDVQEVMREVNNKKKDGSERRRRRKKRASRLSGVSSKSLSDLEFEELKGFMDLGFVFTEEECRDSRLVSMIPGLQRFCKTCTGGGGDHHHGGSDDHDHDHHDGDDHVVVGGHSNGDQSRHGVISRPYLSEAWDVLESEERRKKIHDQIVRPLAVIDWKVPTTLGDNEIYMKDQLKFWAHSVASTVR